ncbi:MAG: hypothetical protein SGJ09_15185 [Phycisphaerae bacterium]|nr:hypothetical protein [Phycisphaerae bacterium]
MSRQIKNVEQIRALLGKMDRLIDDARCKREGNDPLSSSPPSATTGSAAGAPTRPVGSQSNQAPRAPAPHALPNSISGTPARQPASGPAPSLPSRPVHGQSPSQSNGRPAQPGLPQRLKAKPKRADSPNPLQDFQQRQAS